MTIVKTGSAQFVFPQIASLLAILVGSLVLVGWGFAIAVLKSILPGWVSVKPNTALAFVLVGIAMFSLCLPLSAFPSHVARLCGVLLDLKLPRLNGLEVLASSAPTCGPISCPWSS